MQYNGDKRSEENVEGGEDKVHYYTTRSNSNVIY